MQLTEQSANWIVAFLNTTNTGRYGATQPKVHDEASRNSLIRDGLTALRGK